jgi:beta-ketodecanoyl-[acyl-carrier-protein] synthase
MHQAAITGHGVFTPSEVITNDELVMAFNAYADRWNATHADAIAAGEVEAKAHSSSDFISPPRASNSATCWTRPACWTPR